MAKRRGNPNWCNPQPSASLAAPSAFEQAVKTFKLLPEEYLHSAALKDWVRANKHNKFVPEHLLEAWGFDDSREARVLLLQDATRTSTD
jgi:hypothetical protein